MISWLRGEKNCHRSGFFIASILRPSSNIRIRGNNQDEDRGKVKSIMSKCQPPSLSNWNGNTGIRTDRYCNHDLRMKTGIVAKGFGKWESQACFFPW